MTDLAYCVNGAYYDMEINTYTLHISDSGIDDPNDKRELLMIRKEKPQRIAFFRNQEWLVQGHLDNGFVTLWQDNCL